MTPLCRLTFVVLSVLVGCSSVALALSDIPSVNIAPNVAIPSVMIGTWTSGTTEGAKNIVRTWLNQGGRGIDEALVYKNQRETAEAIRESGIPRSDLFIESKVPGCGGDAMARSWIQQCLEQLDVEYLDLLLIHAPQGPDCLGTWRVLEEFHQKGMLKAIGVSNFQIADLQPILTNGKVKPAVNQIQFNIFFHDDQLAAFCRQHGITVQSWGPLGGAHHWFKRSIYTDPTVAAIAQAHKVSAAQVALRWVFQHNLTYVVLSGNAMHQQNDADIFEFSLTDADMQQLDSLPHQPPVVQRKSDASIPALMSSRDMQAPKFSIMQYFYTVATVAAVIMLAATARFFCSSTSAPHSQDLEAISSSMSLE